MPPRTRNSVHLSPVIVFAEELEHVQRISALLLELSIPYRIAPRPTADCIAFCHRVARAVIVASNGDPMAHIVQVRTAGIELPIVCIGDTISADLKLELKKECGVVWRPRFVSCSSLKVALREAIGLAPEKGEPPEPGVWLDSTLLRAGYSDQSVRLTRSEFALLEALTLHCGKTINLHTLGTYAWGETMTPRGAHQLVTVHIHHLRRKLAEIGLDDVIQTVRHVGYVFRPNGTEQYSEGRGRSLSRADENGSSPPGYRR